MATARTQATGPGFDPGPFPEERPLDEPAKPRRALQASLLLGLVALTAALVVAVPDRDDGSSDDSTRVEADGPTASAELLASDRSLDVDGSLADTGGLGGPSESFFEQPDPSGSLSLSYRHLTGVVEPVAGTGTSVDEPGSSTTAGWVEPTLPPQSEWVDAGNGVLVPDLQLRIRYCESTNDYTAANRSSSARGAYQFLQSSWSHYGFAERFGVAEAHLATPTQQDQAALEVLQSQGTAPWTASRECWSDPDLTPTYASVKPAPKPAPTPATTATTVADGSSTTETSTDGSTTTVADDTTTTDPPGTTVTTTDPSSTTATSSPPTT